MFDVDKCGRVEVGELVEGRRRGWSREDQILEGVACLRGIFSSDVK